MAQPGCERALRVPADILVACHFLPAVRLKDHVQSAGLLAGVLHDQPSGGSQPV